MTTTAAPSSSVEFHHPSIQHHDPFHNMAMTMDAKEGTFQFTKPPPSSYGFDLPNHSFPYHQQPQTSIRKSSRNNKDQKQTSNNNNDDDDEECEINCECCCRLCQHMGTVI